MSNNYNYNSNIDITSNYWNHLQDDYSIVWNKKKLPEPLPSTNWYFAFGSNMSRKRMQKRGLIWDHILKAKLPNYELCFEKKAYSIGEGFANIRKKDGEIVEGVLYKLEDKKQAHILDDFEGTPVHYERKEITVNCKQFKQPVKAFTYIANPKQVESGLNPSEDYLSHLLDGKRYLSSKYHYWISQTKTGCDYSNNPELPVFVYGTLKTGFGNHNKFCMSAFMIKDAVLDGTLYNMGLPYVTVPKENQFCIGSMDYKRDCQMLQKLHLELEQTQLTIEPEIGVQGELLFFDDWNNLTNIDALEGFRGKDSQNHYTRVLTTCWMNGIEEPCFVYVENNAKFLLESDIIQNGDYSNSIDDFLVEIEPEQNIEESYPELYEDEKDLVDLIQNAAPYRY